MQRVATSDLQPDRWYYDDLGGEFLRPVTVEHRDRSVRVITATGTREYSVLYESLYASAVDPLAEFEAVANVEVGRVYLDRVDGSVFTVIAIATDYATYHFRDAGGRLHGPYDRAATRLVEPAPCSIREISEGGRYHLPDVGVVVTVDHVSEITTYGDDDLRVFIGDTDGESYTLRDGARVYPVVYLRRERVGLDE